MTISHWIWHSIDKAGMISHMKSKNGLEIALGPLRIFRSHVRALALWRGPWKRANKHFAQEHFLMGSFSCLRTYVFMILQIWSLCAACRKFTLDTCRRGSRIWNVTDHRYSHVRNDQRRFGPQEKERRGRGKEERQEQRTRRSQHKEAI